MSGTIPNPRAGSIRASESVLRIAPFRRLWSAMSFSSFGDWLGLLATTALAQQLAGGDYATANFAIAGVFIARLLTSVILGPLAGVIADRFERIKILSPANRPLARRAAVVFRDVDVVGAVRCNRACRIAFLDVGVERVV